MNRRAFLQTLGALIGAALVAPELVGAAPRAFDPRAQYGNYIVHTGEASPEIAHEVVRDARTFLPPGAPFKVWSVRPAPSSADPLDQRGYVCWKYSPADIIHGAHELIFIA